MELLPHGGQHGAPGLEVRTERDPTGAQGLADLLGHTSLLSGEERTCQRPELPRFRAGATPAGGPGLGSMFNRWVRVGGRPSLSSHHCPDSGLISSPGPWECWEARGKFFQSGGRVPAEGFLAACWKQAGDQRVLSFLPLRLAQVLPCQPVRTQSPLSPHSSGRRFCRDHSDWAKALRAALGPCKPACESLPSGL